LKERRQTVYIGITIPHSGKPYSASGGSTVMAVWCPAKARVWRIQAALWHANTSPPLKSRTPPKVPRSSSLNGDGINLPVLQPVLDPSPLQRMPHDVSMLTQFHERKWTSIFRSSLPVPEIRPGNVFTAVVDVVIWPPGYAIRHVCTFEPGHVPQTDLAGNAGISG